MNDKDFEALQEKIRFLEHELNEAQRLYRADTGVYYKSCYIIDSALDKFEIIEKEK